MKHDTPLPEVAHHLPTDAAATLSEHGAPIQELVLESVRTFIVAIEDQAELDSLQWDAILGVYVANQIALFREVTAVHYRLQVTHQKTLEIVEMTRMQA